MISKPKGQSPKGFCLLMSVKRADLERRIHPGLTFSNNFPSLPLPNQFMTVKMKFFAQTERWMGIHELVLDSNSYTAPVELSELLKRESAKLSPIKSHLNTIRVAVNHEFATFNTVIRNGDEIAFIPPVSGG